MSAKKARLFFPPAARLLSRTGAVPPCQANVSKGFVRVGGGRTGVVPGSYRRTGNADPDQLGPPRLGLHNCKLVQIEGVQKLVMAAKKAGLFFPPPPGFEPYRGRTAVPSQCFQGFCACWRGVVPGSYQGRTGAPEMLTQTSLDLLV